MDEEKQGKEIDSPKIERVSWWSSIFHHIPTASSPGRVAKNKKVVQRIQMGSLKSLRLAILLSHLRYLARASQGRVSLPLKYRRMVKRVSIDRSIASRGEMAIFRIVFIPIVFIIYIILGPN